MRDRMAGVRNRNPAHGVDGPPPQCNPHSPNTPQVTKRDLDVQNSLNTTAIRVLAGSRSPKPACDRSPIREPPWLTRTVRSSDRANL